MKIKTILFLGVLLCSVMEINAQKMRTVQPTLQQESKSQGVNDLNRENEHPYGGTFQFISDRNHPREIFTTDILKLIEEKRKDNDEVILTLSKYTKVKILSRKEISSPGFAPITTLYSFE